MTIANATKKLEKAGFTVEKLEYGFHASNKSFPRVIEFHRNGRSDEVICIKVRRPNDNDDSMRDYSAGSFADSITQAIRRAAN
jgi:hypothetical protein